MRLKLLSALFTFAMLACSISSSAIPAATAPVPTDTPTPKPTIPPGATGMILRGHVTLDGKGLAGVEMYRNIAVYPAEIVAVTDENGYYESGFFGIPGDEMVSLEPKLAGYTFDPPYYYWRHYHGYVEYTWDFTATLMP